MLITAPIYVNVIDKKTKLPVCNIIAIMTIFAKRKNNYSIRGISDANGRIVFTREGIKEEIQRERNLFIMDFSSNLENCAQDVDLSIYDQRQLDSAIEGLRAWKNIISDYDAQVEMLNKARPAKMDSQTIRATVNPDEATEIILEVY